MVMERLPNAELSIVGHNAPGCDVRGVSVVGPVADLAELLNSVRVNLAPLRYGAGMKSKVAAGLAAGLPTVTTEVGAEGFSRLSDLAPIIAESTAGFADAVVSLLVDDALWEAAASASLEEAHRSCGPGAVKETATFISDLVRKKPNANRVTERRR